MGNLVGAGIWIYRPGLETFGFALVFVAATYVFCGELPVSDHRCATAERQGRGYRRSFRRRGQPDGLWTTRCSNGTVASHHVVRDYVHGVRNGARAAHGQGRGAGRLGAGKILEAGGAQAGAGDTWKAADDDTANEYTAIEYAECSEQCAGSIEATSRAAKGSVDFAICASTAEEAVTFELKVVDQVSYEREHHAN